MKKILHDQQQKVWDKEHQSPEVLLQNWMLFKK
jgi:hypothetical protein